MLKLLAAPFRLFAPLKKFGYRLFFALGVGIAVLFIAWSLLLDKQSIAVFLAAIGAGLGALIISLTLPKWLLAADGDRQKQLALELQKTMQDKAKLVIELERVKSQQLQMQQIQTVMKLTLLEVDVSLTDFKQADLGEREKTLGGKTNTQYIGVLRKKAKVMLGLDLAQIRVQQMGKELLVDSLHAAYQGMSGNSDEWLFRQLQVHENNLVMPNRVNVNVDSNALMHASDLHRDDLNQRINNGVELKAFDQTIEKMGEQWLKLMFAPMGLTVRLASIDQENSILLLDHIKSTQLNLDHAQKLLEGNVAES
ncbi:MAG: hypothetical protein WBP13_07060 [Methylophilaceae bacterium]